MESGHNLTLVLARQSPARKEIEMSGLVSIMRESKRGVDWPREAGEFEDLRALAAAVSSCPAGSATSEAVSSVIQHGGRPAPTFQRLGRGER